VISAHPGQGWSLLCNGIVIFNDTGAECPHWPPCPASSQPGRLAAAVISAHPGQGWSLLCNGVVVFDDTGYLLPDGTARGPRPPGRVPARATA
jgi:hypothetical protein